MSNPRINVLFSRPKEMLQDASNVLPSNRFKLIPCPTINIKPVEQFDDIDQAFKDIESFDYLIFTSQYAVLSTMEHLKRLGISSKRLSALTICTVGPMVSQQLNRFELNTHMIPQIFTAASLCDLFSPIRRSAKKILFPKGNGALGVIESLLQRKGYDVVAPVVYRTEFRQNLASEINRVMGSEPIDCVAFTSPSSVFSLAATLNVMNRNDFFDGVAIAAIGPSTKKACYEVGWPVNILPIEFTVQSMARAVLKYFHSNPKLTR